MLSRSNLVSTVNFCRTDIIIVQPRQSPGIFGHFAGTAAGVAAGTVIGDKITGKNEPQQPSQSPVPPSEQGICTFEEQQFLSCAQNYTDLRQCEAYREAFAQCKRKHSK